MTKILAHDIRMQKNPQTKEDTFWIFTDFHYGVANPKIVMLLLFQILCIDCFFLKKKKSRLTLNENS